MNKLEFIKAVANKVGLTIKDSTAVLDSMTEIITDTLKSGDKVVFGNIGTFEVKQKAERDGFNPIKKEAIKISASKVPVLKIGKAYKSLFN